MWYAFKAYDPMTFKSKIRDYKKALEFSRISEMSDILY